jgi:hypothetical protein
MKTKNFLYACLVLLLFAGAVMCQKPADPPVKQTLTPEQVIEMKKAGVSDDVIKAMINGSSVPTAPDTTAGDPGVYAVVDGRPTFIASETFRREDINPATALFKGAVGQLKQHAILEGPSARIRLGRVAVFYFVGDESPNNLTLVRLEKKSSKRQVVVFRASPLGRSAGIEDSKKIKFASSQSGPRRWKIETSLEPGEYAFFAGLARLKEYEGAVLEGKAYTFGVD